MSISERITAAREAAGLSKSELARRLGRSPSAVTQWESGETKALRAESLIGIARETNVRAEWLETGRGSMHDTTNVEPGPDLRGTVPLISWVQAGTWNGAADPFEPGDAERWLECPVRHSERAYALRVRGDSMTAPFGRSYPAGCIIFVDPLARSPVSGQRIIAKLNGADEVTFKVFRNEDGRIWLQPLNPQHPPIFDPFKVLGTVIGKWEDE